MISRKSTKTLADLYQGTFAVGFDSYGLRNRRTHKYHLNKSELYDFLYENDYSMYLLNIVKGMSDESTERRVRELVLELHTGETLAKGTPNWTWEAREKLGQRYLKDLAENIISFYEKKREKGKVKELTAHLELDGYVYREGTLYQIDTSVINEQEEQSYLENLIDRLALSDKDIIKHHIKNAEEHYVNGKWDDSIANSRKFLEAILAQIAEAFNVKKYTVSLSPSKLQKPFEVRDYLEREKLIETKEKEAIAKVYGLLSGTGSHPYIAEKDQARLMWHLALTFSQFVLLRYEGYLKSNP